jgi:hypothetical protein
MRYQQNSILSRTDGVFQLSALAALRALQPKFWNQHLRNGPFTLNLLDLHQSNVMVDDDWNVVGIIDLEFAPVLPRHMVRVPAWLSGHSVDQLVGPALEGYKVLYDHFVSILEEEETSRQQDNALSRQMREDWDSGRLWYNAALRSSNGFPAVFDNNIQPRFFDKLDEEQDRAPLMRLWDENCEDFITAKLQDKTRYDERIREIFATARAGKEKDEQEKVTEVTTTDSTL